FGDPEADIVLIACGTASAQSKEAVRLLEDEGIMTKVIKLKTIRPFPVEELRSSVKNARYIFVPEFNVVGWLEREVRRYLYGHSKADIIGSPRVAGGMTMPPEVIAKEILKLTGKEVKHVI
ncbi:MAG: transketolase C-terminal domain-containing protein, partial [Aquificaceae bacterium]